MPDFSANFKLLETNVKLLIKRKVEMEKDLQESKLAYEKLALELRSSREEIEDLKEKNKILRIAGGTKGGDNREMKLKINEIVREVDKCIAQLNQ